MSESKRDGGTSESNGHLPIDNLAAATESGAAPAREPRRRAPSGGADELDASADERSQEALEFARDVILKMGMDCDVLLQEREEDDESGDIHIQVTGPDAGRIIGKKGQVLAAVQFIVNRAMNRPGLERRYVSVDADGYRSRREDSLASMARRLGRQAVSDGQIITFEPMSPRDRRVVHLALAKFDGVVTKSEGEGDDRRVQIIPVRRG
jgi:spoIIIJ-associated protein